MYIGFSKMSRAWGMFYPLAISIALLGVEAAQESKDTSGGLPLSCSSQDPRNVTVSCQGVRIVRRIVKEFLENSKKQPDIEIFDGVSLVQVKSDGPSRRARFLKGFGSAGPFLQLLEGRELRIKLPTLLPQNLEAALGESLPRSDEARGGGGGGGGLGGGGKKGGGGGIMLLALMMGKMMATLGFGALAMVAMKALMVSALALMLSLVIGIKKLASHGDDDHGGHHVVYAQDVGHHHHHRKRSVDENESADLPYRGYAKLYNNLMVS